MSCNQSYKLSTECLLCDHYKSKLKSFSLRGSLPSSKKLNRLYAILMSKIQHLKAMLLSLSELQRDKRMKFKGKEIDPKELIESVANMLDNERSLSPAFAAAIKLMLFLMEHLINRVSLNSKNSSKPPSTDHDKDKGKDKDSNENKKNNKDRRKPGGQPGRTGTQLKPVSNPDEVKVLEIDQSVLPKGRYKDVGYESRQVIDFKISVHVIEYRAQILEDANGKQFVAEFPIFVTRPVQYGTKIKATAVYMTQYQFLPYNRNVDYFTDHVGLNLSPGSIFNFNKEAYTLLERFEQISKERLIISPCVNSDETGINIAGKRKWLHTACNEKWTHFFPHDKRGTEAMDDIGILPHFKGFLCHDHWKAYFKYDCSHVLCNAHHLRELEWSATEDKQQWATELRDFLKKLNIKVKNAGGNLTKEQSAYYLKRYKQILHTAEQECPVPNTERKKGKRGRMKKSKSRNLLERLSTYHKEVLRFMNEIDVPFTNNQGENDLRMAKVQQKISGCFRSLEGAKIFCRIRGYLNTCRKHGVDATEALEILFGGKLPDFANRE